MKTFSLILAACLVSCHGSTGEELQTAERVPAVEASATPARVQGETAAGGQPSVEAVRAAIRRSLPFVEEQGVAWMEGRVGIQEGAACVSCHHVGYSLWGQKEAHRAGVAGQDGLYASLTASAVEFMEKPDIPRAISTGSMLLGEARPSDSLIASMLDLQKSEGHWRARGQYPTQRRPVPESDAVATLWSLIALHWETAHWEKESSETLEARKKALAWLGEQDAGTSTEWVAASLLLAEALDEESRAAELRTELLDRQNPDGGWGWLADDPSEAFSTGQAVYALALATGKSRAEMHRGVTYLLRSQEEDGTWKVAASAVSREPSEDKDVIYEFWGTAWATIGLSRSLPDGAGS